MDDSCLPLITIITLSYNSPDLYGAIDSVLAQKYEAIEYIVLDDNSNFFDVEEVKKYISEHQHGNIVRLIVEKNTERKGIVKQTNKAYSYSTGKYVFNLACDDQFYDENVIADWVEEFQKTNADIITAYREVFDNKLEKSLYNMPTEEEVAYIKTLTPKQLFEIEEGYNIVFGCSTAKTKKCILDIGPIPEQYEMIEDYIFILRSLRANKKISFFDRMVLKYRSGGICSTDSISKKYLKENDAIFENEILPFTSNKRLAKKKYRAWRHGTLIARHKNQYLYSVEKANGNRILIFFAALKLGLRHPFHSIKKIFSKKKHKNKPQK